MDKLILGLLMLKDLTVYEIQMFLRQGMHLMYSDSMGSIQAAIKKIMKEEYVTYTEQIGNGKIKKIYTITSTGKKHFNHWLSQPIKPGMPQNRVLCKLFFLGLLPKQEREPLIRDYIHILEDKLVTLNSTHQKAKSVIFDDCHRDIQFFQLATIQLSIESLQCEINWYNTFVKMLMEEKDLV